MGDDNNNPGPDQVAARANENELKATMESAIQQAQQAKAKADLVESTLGSQLTTIRAELARKIGVGELIGKDGVKIAGKTISVDPAAIGAVRGPGAKNQQSIAVNLLINGVQEVHHFYESGEIG